MFTLSRLKEPLLFHWKGQELRRKLVPIVFRKWCSLLKLGWFWLGTGRGWPKWLWIRAAQAQCSGDYEKAAQLYTNGLSAYPKHPARVEAVLDLASCLYKLNRKDAVISQLLPLVRQHVPAAQIYQLLSHVLLQIGNHRLAGVVLRRGLNLVSGDLKLRLAYFRYLLLSSEDGEPELQKEIFFWKDMVGSSLLDKDFESEVRVCLARNELIVGDEVKAEHLLGDATVLGAYSVEYFLLVADSLFAQQRIVTARDMLGEAMRLDPQDPRPYALMAKSCLRDGVFIDPESAVSFAVLANQASSWRNISDLILLRQAYEASGMDDAAYLMAKRINAHLSDCGNSIEELRVTFNNIEMLKKHLEVMAEKWCEFD